MECKIWNALRIWVPRATERKCFQIHYCVFDHNWSSVWNILHFLSCSLGPTMDHRHVLFYSPYDRIPVRFHWAQASGQSYISSLWVEKGLGTPLSFTMDQMKTEEWCQLLWDVSHIGLDHSWHIPETFSPFVKVRVSPVPWGLTGTRCLQAPCEKVIRAFSCITERGSSRCLKVVKSTGTW